MERLNFLSEPLGQGRGSGCVACTGWATAIQQVHHVTLKSSNHTPSTYGKSTTTLEYVVLLSRVARVLSLSFLKDLKWRTIVAGAEALIADKGLRAEDVVLWCDWQSIYQAA